MRRERSFSSTAYARACLSQADQVLYSLRSSPLAPLKWLQAIEAHEATPKTLTVPSPFGEGMGSAWEPEAGERGQASQAPTTTTAARAAPPPTRLITMLSR